MMLETEDQEEVKTNIVKTGVILLAGCAVISMALAATVFFWILKYVGE